MTRQSNDKLTRMDLSSTGRLVAWFVPGSCEELMAVV